MQTYPHLIKENSIPKGVADFLPEQAEKIGFIEAMISQTFELWGFRKIIPPMLEFEDLLAAGMDDSLRAKLFRFEDRQSHRLLAIPPDITPQIARIESMRMKGYPLPHRLYYSGRVLRHAESQSGRSREIYQAGVELIGLESPEADAEMIAMAVEALRKIGLKDFKIDLGQVDFYRGVMVSAELDSKTASAIQAAIACKDISTVAATLENLNIADSSKNEILALSRLFGGIEVLEKASAAVRNERSKRALDNLIKVIDILSLYGVREELTVDLGEIRGLAYHTGLTFEGFVPGIGEPVCGGGRYDTLMGKYGGDCPATGFAFNTLNLLHVLETSAARDNAAIPSFLIFNMKEDKSTALSIASVLRSRGYTVARDIIRRDFAHSCEYGRFNGLKYALVIGESGVAEDEVLLVKIADDSRRKVKISDLYADAAKLFLKN